MKVLKVLKNKPIILLIAAAILLLASTAGSTTAALNYYSENYMAEVTVSNIGVTLKENDKEISKRNYLEADKWDEVSGKLLTDMLAEGEELILGKDYEEVLTVENSGAIDVYVRVILTKSWKDAQGMKDPYLSPELIELGLVTSDNGWIVDENASTAERTVLYYTKAVPTGESTPAFTNEFGIDPSVGTRMIEHVKTELVDGQELKTVTYTHEYDGYTFCIEAEVDAVQTHNAADAIRSAWGVDVNVTADKSLELQ